MNRETTTSGGAACCASGCCTPQAEAKPAHGKTPLNIELLYLDLEVCDRCRGTDERLEEAIGEVARVLEAAGVEARVEKVHVRSEVQALALGFVASPTIRIDGEDIQIEVRESRCESCGELCGDEVDCRVWTYQGKEYAVPPKALIVDAVLRAVYSRGKKTSPPPVLKKLPKNLKRFFSGKRSS